MDKKLKVVIIGAGNRGDAYSCIMQAYPEKFEVVAVAEPIKSRRESIKQRHNISEYMCFEDWKPLLDLGKIADVAVIATMDRFHYDPTIKAVDLGYDILLEKPAAPTPEECVKIVRRAEEANVKVVVCHVLRYTPMFMLLKKLIDEGKIGDVVAINHDECVGNVHQSHSFVRGNWGNSDKSSCMILQKSCHDLDIIQWLIGKKCKKVSSFGALNYFKKENAPKGAPDYCIQGCPAGDTCPYNAVKVYLDDKENDWFRTTCTREANPTDEMVEKAISTTQYGKCVFKCDNNVTDHQTVNMLFEDGVTASFINSAFNRGGRFMHIMGTKGEIRAAIEGGIPVELYDFETKSITKFPIEGVEGNGDIPGGHGGGDLGIINALYDYLTDNYDGKSVSTIRETYKNHLIAFAAEYSRVNSTMVDFEEFEKAVEERA